MTLKEFFRPIKDHDSAFSGNPVAQPLGLNEMRMAAISDYLHVHIHEAIPLKDLTAAASPNTRLSSETAAGLVRSMQSKINNTSLRIDEIRGDSSLLAKRAYMMWSPDPDITAILPHNDKPFSQLDVKKQIELKPLFLIDVTRSGDKVELKWRLTPRQRELVVHLAFHEDELMYEEDLIKMDIYQGAERFHKTQAVRTDLQRIREEMETHRVGNHIFQVRFHNACVFSTQNHQQVTKSLSAAELKILSTLPVNKERDSIFQKVRQVLKFKKHPENPHFLLSDLNPEARKLFVFLCNYWDNCINLSEISYTFPDIQFTDRLIVNLNKVLHLQGLAVYYVHPQVTGNNLYQDKTNSHKISKNGSLVLSLQHVKDTEITVLVMDLTTHPATTRPVRAKVSYNYNLVPVA